MTCKKSAAYRLANNLRNPVSPRQADNTFTAHWVFVTELKVFFFFKLAFSKRTWQKLSAPIQIWLFKLIRLRDSKDSTNCTMQQFQKLKLHDIRQECLRSPVFLQ